MGPKGVSTSTNCTVLLIQLRREALMKTVLEVRRQKLLREITRVNYQINRTQKQLTSIESRLALAKQAPAKAA